MKLHDYTAQITEKLLPLVGRLFFLLLQTLKCCVSRPFYGGRLVEQIKKLGFDSLLITIVIGITMGLVMTLNFGHGLMKFGGTMYVPKLVSLSSLEKWPQSLPPCLLREELVPGWPPKSLRWR